MYGPRGDQRRKWPGHEKASFACWRLGQKFGWNSRSVNRVPGVGLPKGKGEGQRRRAKAKGKDRMELQVPASGAGRHTARGGKAGARFRGYVNLLAKRPGQAETVW
jgi:hypothetical protein